MVYVLQNTVSVCPSLRGHTIEFQFFLSTIQEKVEIYMEIAIAKEHTLPKYINSLAIGLFSYELAHCI